MKGERRRGWSLFLVTICQWFYLFHLLSSPLQPSLGCQLMRDRQATGLPCLPACLSFLNQELPLSTDKEGSWCVQLNLFSFSPPFFTFTLSLSTLERETEEWGCVFLSACFFFYSSLLWELIFKVASGYLPSEAGTLRHWMQHGFWHAMRVVQFCLQRWVMFTWAMIV